MTIRSALDEACINVIACGGGFLLGDGVCDTAQGEILKGAFKSAAGICVCVLPFLLPLRRGISSRPFQLDATLE
jgi:hypothetical protein